MSYRGYRSLGFSFLGVYYMSYSLNAFNRVIYRGLYIRYFNRSLDNGSYRLRSRDCLHARSDCLTV